jgi:hypothetical protein
MYTVQTVDNWKCSIQLSELFRNLIKIFELLLILWYNAVGIATCYRMDSLGIESQGVQIFYTHPDLSYGPPNLPHKWYRVCPSGTAAKVWC